MPIFISASAISAYRHFFFQYRHIGYRQIISVLILPIFEYQHFEPHRQNIGQIAAHVLVGKWTSVGVWSEPKLKSGFESESIPFSMNLNPENIGNIGNHQYRRIGILTKLPYRHALKNKRILCLSLKISKCTYFWVYTVCVRIKNMNLVQIIM